LISTEFLESFIFQGVMQNLTAEQLEKDAKIYVDYVLKKH